MDKYKVIPCDVFIANYSAKRKENQSYVHYWKARRNANIALRKRLREGHNATLRLDITTMSVVTDREMAFRIRMGELHESKTEK